MKLESVLYWITQLDQVAVENPMRRVLALRTIAHSLDGCPEAVEAAIKSLKEDRQSGVRQTAAQILGEMAERTDAVRHVLAWASEHDDPFVGVAAANALIKPKPPKE